MEMLSLDSNLIIEKNDLVEKMMGNLEICTLTPSIYELAMGFQVRLLSRVQISSVKKMFVLDL